MKIRDQSVLQRSFKKPLYCGRVVIFLTIPLIVFGSSKAQAELGEVFQQFQDYANDFQDYLKGSSDPKIELLSLKHALKPLKSGTVDSILGTADPILGTASGSQTLKLFNPIKARGDANELVTQGNDPKDAFENNLYLRSLLVGNEIDRQITRGAVQSLLGEGGQKRTINALSQVQEILLGTGDDSALQIQNEAQTRKATQDVVKDLVRMQFVQSRLIGENLSTVIQTRQDIQYSNLNLTNISQQMDEVNRAQRVSGSVETARLIKMSAQMGLF